MSVSGWCERALALLTAGLDASRVLQLLGPPPSTAADGGAIRVAWQVCVEVGAPMSRVLASFAASARDWERIARDRATALAGPRAAARLVMLLPVFALVLSASMGLGVLGFLFGSVLGWGCLLAGLAALWAGARWNRRLLRRAEQLHPAPGFACELTAQLVAAGLSPAAASARVDAAWTVSETEDLTARATALRLAEHTGMPPARALAAEAMSLRSDAFGQAEQRAAELAVKLTLPLGLCVLPAFLCWAVLPVLFSLIGSTASAFH